MCMQCMAAATAAVGSATGFRAWVAMHQPAWMTPRRMKAFTAVLLGIAVLASGVSPA